MEVNHRVYFNDLLTLLEEEKKADIEQTEDSRKSTAIQAADGSIWHPVKILWIKRGGQGDFILGLMRGDYMDVPHRFKVGRTIALFNDMANTEEIPLMGRIKAVYDDFKSNSLWQYKASETTCNNMIVSIAEDIEGNTIEDLPSWVDYGSLGVKQTADMPTYKVMYKALQQCLASNNSASHLSNLIHVLIGNKPAGFYTDKKIPEGWVTNLNKCQREAVERILNAKNVAIIHGPPGTGKTTTLVEAICLTTMVEKKVLVTAPSNAAVDLLTEKLAQKGIDVLRIGNPSKFKDNIEQYGLDEQLKMHIDYPLLEEMRNLAEECKSIVKGIKDHALQADLKEMKKEIKALEQHIAHSVFEKTQVITTTLGSANHFSIKDIQFNTVFIDEAGQAIEPACWVPIILGNSNRVIFAGDHKQLPPVVKSTYADEIGLSFTLFEKLIEQSLAGRDMGVTMLQEQYRMHEDIMRFPNKEFYGEKLQPANDEIRFQKLSKNKEDKILFPTIEFIDTSGLEEYEEEKDQETQSKFNKAESRLLVRHLKRLITHAWAVNPTLLTDGLSIGIISPYKAQVKDIQKRIDKKSAFLQQPGYSIDLEINSVDGFQGQEKDIIYLSLVRSNEVGGIGFLKEYRRMNVAITRARKKLVIVGNRRTFSHDPFFDRLIKELDILDAIKPVSEVLTEDEV